MLIFRAWSTCGWFPPSFPQVWYPVPAVPGKWTNKFSCELVCFTFQAEDNMKKYGKSLVNAVPDEATKLLKVLCTDYRPQRLQERKWNSEHFVLSEVCTATSTLRQALCSGTFSVQYYHQFQCCFSLTLRKLEPGKTADISRRNDWFRREMTSEEWVQKFHTVKPL